MVFGWKLWLGDIRSNLINLRDDAFCDYHIHIPSERFCELAGYAVFFP
jgi:hypothetical protein